MDKIERIKNLITEINKHNYNYYVLDNPTIADREYDAIYDELVRLEKETGIVLPDSPTKQVGDVVLKNTPICKSYIRLINATPSRNLKLGLMALTKFMANNFTQWNISLMVYK